MIKGNEMIRRGSEAATDRYFGSFSIKVSLSIISSPKCSALFKRLPFPFTGRAEGGQAPCPSRAATAADQDPERGRLRPPSTTAATGRVGRGRDLGDPTLGPGLGQGPGIAGTEGQGPGIAGTEGQGQDRGRETARTAEGRRPGRRPRESTTVTSSC